MFCVILLNFRLAILEFYDCKNEAQFKSSMSPLAELLEFWRDVNDAFIKPFILN